MIPDGNIPCPGGLAKWKWVAAISGGVLVLLALLALVAAAGGGGAGSSDGSHATYARFQIVGVRIHDAG